MNLKMKPPLYMDYYLYPKEKGETKTPDFFFALVFIQPSQFEVVKHWNKLQKGRKMSILRDI